MNTDNASRFFWFMLFAAASASVAANIAHALFNGSAGNAAVAAAAAVVPPAVLLGATHGVALLVQARTSGWTYITALGLTVALGGCAFVLSFDALRSLAIEQAGYRPGVAWLWPLSIDLSIAVSTIALLALTGSPHRAPAHQVIRRPAVADYDEADPRTTIMPAITPQDLEDHPAATAAPFYAPKESVGV